MCSDVVIVAHNPGRLLAESVASAVEQAGPDHVWVVDAASTDGSIDRLVEQGHPIRVVQVPNLGLAAANNTGLRLTSSAFVLLLNPDAVLCPGALDALLATGKANPRAGIVGPLILNVDASVQANSFGRFPSLLASLSLRWWRVMQRLRANASLSPKAPTSTVSVDWVTGAAMLVRRAAVDDVGPMDEGFFLYYEDTDWCHRMHDNAWEVLLEPEARVVHHLGGSAAPEDTVAQAYRASFYRYCSLYGLWGLKACSRLGLSLRGLFGGAR